MLEIKRYKEISVLFDSVSNMNDTINLLNDVGVYEEDGFDKLQWSVIYNLTSMSGKIWAHRNKNNIIDFELK